jgi:hypothetical protein
MSTEPSFTVAVAEKLYVCAGLRARNHAKARSRSLRLSLATKPEKSRQEWYLQL